MRNRRPPLMLFAAGLGTRMRPLTDARPKPLVEVAGRPLIDHALDLAGAAGIGRIVVNLHYLPGQIRDHLAGRSGIAFSEEGMLLDTGGGLKKALPLLGDGPVLTLNTDAVWTDPLALKALLSAWDPARMEALLAPTVLYSPVTEALWKAGVRVHYCANITGHGWRKLLRHAKTLTYRIHTLPPVPPVLSFIQEHAGHDAREAYSTLNMGAGFALFVDRADAQRTVDIAQAQGVGARVAGVVEAGPKQLVIEPLSITFGDDALQLR
jgi:GTP:adenosylcobinamide-phosphate guanylyltransferase